VRSSYGGVDKQSAVEPSAVVEMQSGQRTAENGPIYIAGLDRTGKTTLRSYLASHSRIAIPDVGSNMWTYFYRRFGDLGVDENLERCLDAMVRYKHVAFLRPDRARIEREFRSGEPSYARLFALFLRHYGEGQGKPRWGAQTGLAERYGHEMFAAYAGLSVVHMVRDPRDRYEASLEKWPNGRMRAGGAVSRFNYSYSLGRSVQQQFPDRYLFVRFEDLVGDTVGTVKKVIEFLGESFEEPMLDMPSAKKFRSALVTNHPDGLPRLHPSVVGRYRNGRIPDAELFFIEQFASTAMSELGYERTTTLTSSERARYLVARAPLQVSKMAAWRTVEACQQRFPNIAKRNFGSRMIVEPANA
jgi:hypothetical protein